MNNQLTEVTKNIFTTTLACVALHANNTNTSITNLHRSTYGRSAINIVRASVGRNPCKNAFKAGLRKTNQTNAFSLPNFRVVAIAKINDKKIEHPASAFSTCVQLSFKSQSPIDNKKMNVKANQHSLDS